MSNISFISEEIIFSLKNKTVVKNWIKQTIATEGKRVGGISVVFCSDDY
jgi:hypothetical protein